MLSVYNACTCALACYLCMLSKMVKTCSLYQSHDYFSYQFLSYAGHLPVKEEDRGRRYRSLVATYVTFGPTGHELLANLGGEQVYLFDVNNRQKPRLYNVGDYQAPNSNGYCTNGVCKGTCMSFSCLFIKKKNL